jgi:2-methylcitrate dehydratase
MTTSSTSATQLSATLLTPWLTKALSTRFADLPATVVEQACGRVLDSVACAMGAWPCEPGKIARSLGERLTPAAGQGARLWGTLQPTLPELATFANGILVRYLDFNDTYLSKEPAHPSDNIAALVAIAEQAGATGEALITAIALAYEAQCRLCDATSIRSRGWDHVNYGSISVALGGSYLMGLSVEQTLNAISLALTGHVAMRQTRVGELSHWKGCAFANSARNAVMAVYMAQAGMTGPRQIIEGEMGFMAQVSGPFDWPEWLADGEWMLPKTYIKHYPAEYHSQSAIEAALTLRQQIADVSQIESIHIDTFDAAVEIIAGFEEHWKPQSRETADHSMPYCVTAALLDGDITLASFDDARRNDPTLLDLLQNVTIRRDAALNAGYPAGIPNRVTITLSDFSRLSHEITYPLGHAGNAMSKAELTAKFTQLALTQTTPDHASQMATTVWGLANLNTVSQLVDVLHWGK